MEAMGDEDFPANEGTPGQAASRAARTSLENWLKEQEKRPAWFELWEDLRAERGPMLGADGEPLLNEQGQARTRRRWDWRKALYIAWASLPRPLREPKTLEGLVSLLGLSSSGAIRNWRRKDAGIMERIASLPAELLLEHVADVLDALTTVASDPDPKAHPDRKLFLEITRVYHPRGVVELAGRVEVDTDEPLEDEDQTAVEELLRERAGAKGSGPQPRPFSPGEGAHGGDRGTAAGGQA